MCSKAMQHANGILVQQFYPAMGIDLDEYDLQCVLEAIKTESEKT